MKQAIDRNLLRSAEEARNHLIEGNQAFIDGDQNLGDTTHDSGRLNLPIYKMSPF